MMRGAARAYGRNTSGPAQLGSNDSIPVEGRVPMRSLLRDCGISFVFFLLGSVGAEVAGAQYASDKSMPETAATAPRKFEFGVEGRWRFEFRNNSDFLPADDFDGFTGQRIRLNFTFRPTEKFTLFIQPQDVWIWDANSDKVIHDLATNLHQAYFDWKLGNDWELRGGRQEFNYGEERLLGGFGWDHVGRSFDGARLRQKVGNWTGDYLWGRLVDVRRNGARARAGAMDLSGAYFTHAAKDAPGRTEVYGLFLRDSFQVRGEISTNPLETTRIFTLGFRRFYRPKTGFRYSLESALQLGERGPDNHRAGALIATAGYAWGDAKWKPWVQAEYSVGSGDGNPGDGKSREFHNLFPTNHLFYGYADLLGLRNMHNIRFTAAVSPHAKFAMEFDYHHFWLAEARGPWKNAGGRVLASDPTGAAGRNLGNEVDLTFRLPLHKHFWVVAGYSAFFPGRFVKTTRGPETQHWGFLMPTVRF
jgi:hypothetical protein